MKMTGPEFQFQSLQARTRQREHSYLPHDERELHAADIRAGRVYIPRKGDRRRVRFVCDWTDGRMVRWSCPKQHKLPPCGQCSVRQFLAMVIRVAKQ